MVTRSTASPTMLRMSHRKFLRTSVATQAPVSNARATRHHHRRSYRSGHPGCSSDVPGSTKPNARPPAAAGAALEAATADSGVTVGWCVVALSPPPSGSRRTQKKPRSASRVSALVTYAWIAAATASPPRAAPTGEAMDAAGTPAICTASVKLAGGDAAMLPLGGGMAGNANQYT